MVPTEPVSSFSNPKPHSDTEHILHHNGQLPNPVFWLSGNKLELRPRDLESHNCTIFLQHQTLQLTKVKFVEEENSLPKCVSFTINTWFKTVLCVRSQPWYLVKDLSMFGFCDIHNFTNATECLQEDVMMFVTKSPMLCTTKWSCIKGSQTRILVTPFRLWKKTAADNTNKVQNISLNYNTQNC